MLGPNRKESGLLLPRRMDTRPRIPLSEHQDENASEERVFSQRRGMKTRVDSSPQLKSPSSRLVEQDGRDRKTRLLKRLHRSAYNSGSIKVKKVRIGEVIEVGEDYHSVRYSPKHSDSKPLRSSLAHKEDEMVSLARDFRTQEKISEAKEALGCSLRMKNLSLIKEKLDQMRNESRRELSLLQLVKKRVQRDPPQLTLSPPGERKKEQEGLRNGAPARPRTQEGAINASRFVHVRSSLEKKGKEERGQQSAGSTPSKLTKLIRRFKRVLPTEKNSAEQPTEQHPEISTSRVERAGPPFNNFFSLKKASEGSQVVPLWGTGFDTQSCKGNRYLGGEESEHSLQERSVMVVPRTVEMMESPREQKKKSQLSQLSRNKQIATTKSVTSQRREKGERTQRTPQGGSWERRPKFFKERHSLGKEEEESNRDVAGKEKRKMVSLKRNSKCSTSRSAWFHRPDCSATRVQALQRVYKRYFQGGGGQSWMSSIEREDGKDKTGEWRRSRLNLSEQKGAREELKRRGKGALTAAEYIRKFEALETKIFT